MSKGLAACGFARVRRGALMSARVTAHRIAGLTGHGNACIFITTVPIREAYPAALMDGVLEVQWGADALTATGSWRQTVDVTCS